MGKRTDPAISIRVTPAMKAGLREVAAVYREAGVPTSVTALVWRYMVDGLLRDAYGVGKPPHAACAPEAVAGLTAAHAMPRQSHDQLLARIRERRGQLMRQVAAVTQLRERDPEAVTAELEAINAEVRADDAAS